MSVSTTPVQAHLSIKSEIKQAKSETAVAPQKVIDAALRNARKEWGLPINAGKAINTKRTNWSGDCGNIPLALCDLVVLTGWKVTIADGNKSWVYFVPYSADRAILLGRNPQNRTTTSLPKLVRDNILNMSSKHLNLSKDILLVKQVDRKIWKDICSEFALPYVKCRGDDKKLGWQVIIEGKYGQKYVYLASEKGEEVRTEASTEMASRNDLMPNSWAEKIAKTASKKFQVPTNRVYILSAEQKADSNRGNYFWDVSIDVQGQRLQYELDISGDITKQP